MWDPLDQTRPTFLGIIDMLEPLAQKYQKDEAVAGSGGAQCCVVS
jgi:hypothetical protein